MPNVTAYVLKPTALVPNSPRPLLHYKKALSPDQLHPQQVQRRFAQNGWEAQWLVRYGPTQRSHYHSAVHECMAVLSGTATIRFGVADTTEDMEKNTWGDGTEAGGLELRAEPGDLFVIPAGVAHKTYAPEPRMEFLLLSGGDGHSIGPDQAAALEAVQLSGFTMLGAYPLHAAPWDIATGGEHENKFEQVWNVAPPTKDPLWGESQAGLPGLWQQNGSGPGGGEGITRESHAE